MKNTIVLDNGASSIKTGLVDFKLQSSANRIQSPRIILNAIVRSKGDKATYFGHEIERCRDYSSLNYRLPFEKGYIVDWDAQKAIWDGVFSDEVLDIDTTQSSLILTEPYFNLSNIQEVYDQFVFEEYEFMAYHRCSPASLIPFGTLFHDASLPAPECMIVIDSGFSFTHVLPILSGKIIWEAVRRLDVGGKLLTNQLKELVSFRQWNMMDETYIMNDVKESCCYVATNFKHDLETTRVNPKDNPIVQHYILPDMSANRRGRIRQPDDIASESDQVLLMNNERFSVPEIIFRPDDIGLDQSGLAETVAISISLLPDDLQGMFWSNIGLIGGNTKFPGFRQRLISELQSLAPVDCEIGVFECDDPITEAYYSALQFAQIPAFARQVVTRAEYLESGSNASHRKFQDWKVRGARDKPNDPANPKTRDASDRSQPANRPTRTKSRGNVSTSAATRRR